MFEVWIINEAIMGQSSAGQYADVSAAVSRAKHEAESKRSFVRMVVLAPNGRKVFEQRGAK